MSVCYFHLDLDGMSSAALIKQVDPDCYCIPINYGWGLKRENVRKGERVYVVDFSFEKDDMIWLATHTDLVWIDHHQISLDDLLPVLGDKVPGLQSDKLSGVELTWKWLHGEKPMPRAVSLIGHFDRWQLWDFPGIVEFTKGCSDLNLWPATKDPKVFEHWDMIFSDDTYVDEIIAEGRKIYAREIKENKLKMKARSFTSTFGGYTAICANIGLVDSMMFDSVVDPSIHDVIVGFYRHKRGYWKVSVREVDKEKGIHIGKLCRKVAATIDDKISAGGHAGAGALNVRNIRDLEFAKDF